MANQKATYADIKARKKPVTKTLVIALDPEAASTYAEALAVFTKAEAVYQANSTDRDSKIAFTKAKAALAEAKTEIEENSMEFTFKALGRTKIDELVSDNPATKAQLKEAAERGQEVQWNADTFPPALISASLVSPELTLEEAQEMWDSDDWNQSELIGLFYAALEVNQNRPTVDLKKG